MNISFQNELQLFAEELYEHLPPSFLENLARELGFVPRKRKFSEDDLETNEPTWCILYITPQIKQ